VTDEKPLTLYLAYFLSDLTNDTSNEIVRKIQQHYLIRYLFFDKPWSTFFYAVYIFLFVLIENFLLNIRTLKERTAIVYCDIPKVRKKNRERI
jgi:hypothetical protein